MTSNYQEWEAEGKARIAALSDDEIREEIDKLKEESADLGFTPDELKFLRNERDKRSRAETNLLKKNEKAKKAADLDAFSKAEIVWCCPPYGDSILFFDGRESIEHEGATYFLSEDGAKKYADDISESGEFLPVYRTPRPPTDTVRPIIDNIATTFLGPNIVPPRIKDEIVLVSETQIAKSADTDSSLIQLFIATKRSPKTQEQYRHSTRMLVGFIGKPLQGLTLQDAVDYHAWLKERYESAHSVKLHINVAKALCAFGLKLNYLRTNVFAVIKTDTPPEVTHHRILTEEEVLKLIDAPKRQRDKLLLRLIYAAGLRVSEICNLTWGDLSSDGVLYIQAGKGQKDRFVTLSEAMVKKLVAFKGDATSDTPMFQSQAKNDSRRKSATARLDESQVHRIVKAAAESAGISADASAHWLRHSHASHSLDRGASIVTVRDTLGHSSIATTNKYLHSKRKDSSALHLAV